MCAPPCGPRRHYRSSYTPVEKVTKRDVEEIITSSDYKCLYRMGNSTENQEYEGCMENLIMILHDAQTRVRIAGPRSKDYLAGFRTVVMTAPCFPATLLLRLKK